MDLSRGPAKHDRTEYVNRGCSCPPFIVPRVFSQNFSLKYEMFQCVFAVEWIVKRALTSRRPRSKTRCGGFYSEKLNDRERKKEREKVRDRKVPILFGVQDGATLAPIYSRRVCATNFTASFRECLLHKARNKLFLLFSHFPASLF